MAGQGILTFASDALKLVYGDLHEQLRDKTPALDYIQASAAHLTQNGKEARFDTHVGRNVGIGARDIRETLPSAGAQKYKQASLYLKNLYGAIEVDGQLFEQAADNYNSFINVVDNEIKGLKKDLARDFNRQIYGDGTGTIASVATTATGTQIVMDSTTWADVDMTVSFIRAGSVVGSQVTIVSINETTKTITFSASVAAVAGDKMVRSSNGSTNYNKEITGLGAIVASSGSLHGIDPATTPVWASTVTTLGTPPTPATLTELNLINLVQKVDKQGGDVDVFLASPGVYNAYWNLLQGMRQFTNQSELTGGQRSFSFEALGKPIKFISDYASPINTLYALTSSELVLNRKRDWAWMDRDGSMWNRVGETDAYQARLFQYCELGTYRRNAHAKLSNIAEL